MPPYTPRAYELYPAKTNEQHAKELLHYLMATPAEQMDTIGVLIELTSAVRDIYHDLISVQSPD